MKQIKKILLWVVIGIIILAVLSVGKGHATNPKAFLHEDTYFTYETSLTSARELSEKAHIYKTDLTVSETARYLIERTTPEQYSDLSNDEYISLMYEDQYVFVYAGENNITYVQVSQRQYAYHGSSRLYRARNYGAWDFFRDYYFIKALTRDTHRYGGRSYYEYEDYNPSTMKNIKTTIPSKNTQIDTKKITPSKNTQIDTKKITSSKNTQIDTKKVTPSSTIKKPTSTKIERSNNYKIKRPSIGGSVRRSSVGTRRSIGGGTRFGK